MAYDASVKFNSGQAERNINSLSGKIGSLSKKFRDAHSAARTMGSGVRVAEVRMSEATNRAMRLTNTIKGAGDAARKAARDMGTLGKSLATGDMARAAGILKGLSVHLTTAATRMRQLRTHAGSLPALFNNLARSSVTAALGVERLARALGTSLPAMQRAVGVLTALGAALRGSAGSYRVSVSGLSAVGTASKKATSGVRGVTGAMTQSGSSARKYARDLQVAKGSLLGFAASAVRTRNVVAYLAAGFGVTEIFQMTDAFKNMQAKLSIVSKTGAEAAASFQALAESSNRTRTPLEDNVKAFVRFRIAGERYNMTAGQSLRLTENFNKMLIIGGATTSEAAAATQQLSQAFAKGRLDGDEFKSIMENSAMAGKLFATELKSLGIDMGNLRQAAKEGQIDVKAMMTAFASDSVTKKLQEQFAKMPLTIGQAFTVAKNNLTLWLGKVDSASGFTAKLAHWIVKLSYNLDTLGRSAMIVAGIWAVSYIPKLVEVIRLSRILAGLSLASYFLGVTNAAKGAATAMSLWSGVMKTSSASALSPFMQRLGNLKAATTLTMGSMGTAFRMFFMRVPILAAVGITAMVAWDKKVKQIGEDTLTFGDYVHAGLSVMFDSFTSWLTGIWSQFQADMKGAGASTIREIDRVYRALKGLRASFAAVESWSLKTDPSKPWGFTFAGDNPVDAFKKGYNSGGIAQDIGDTFSGTEVERRARGYAAARRNGGYDPSVLGSTDYNDMDFDNGSTNGKDGKKKKGKKEKKGKDEIQEMRDAYKSLLSQIDETEAKRSEFNEGMKTLNDAFQNGIISSDTFKDNLKDLAKNVFPGLKDQIDSLKSENLELGWKAKGADDWEVKFRQAAEEVKKQVDFIDKIVATQGDQTGTLGTQRQILLDQLRTYADMLGTNKQLTQAAEQRAKREEEVKDIIKTASDELYKMLTDRVKDALSFSGNAFKKFFKGLLGIAKDTAASIISATIFAPMQQKFQSTLEGIFGVGQKKVGSQAATGTTQGVKPNVVESVISIVSGGKEQKTSGDGGTVNINASGGNSSGSVGSTDGGETVVPAAPKWGFWDHFRDGYQQNWKQTFDLFKPLGRVAKDVLGKLGVSSKTLGKVGEAAGKAFGGAQTGQMIAGLAKTLGFKKFSTTGSTIGGALGSLTGIPGGDIIGSIIGGVVGSLFKKNKQATVTLGTGAYGQTSVSDPTGHGAQQKQMAGQMGGALGDALNSVADQLGVNLKKNLSNVVSIGVDKNGDYVVDMDGRGRLKSGDDRTPEFKSEEEAVRYALKVALQKGVLEGLSATSDRYLKGGNYDVDRALQNVARLEEVKKQAIDIRNPGSAGLIELQRNAQKLTDTFKEMGASKEDWKDLLDVVKHSYDQIFDDMTKGLKDFRESLISGDNSYKSPIEKLRLAEGKFNGMEADIASGKFVDQDQYLEAAQKLADLAREVYGSTPEFALYQQRLLAATDKLIDNAETEAEKYKPVVDAIQKAMDAAAAGTGTTNDLLEQIRDGINGGGSGAGGGRVIIGGRTPIRSFPTRNF